MIVMGSNLPKIIIEKYIVNENENENENENDVGNIELLILAATAAKEEANKVVTLIENRQISNIIDAEQKLKNAHNAVNIAFNIYHKLYSSPIIISDILFEDNIISLEPHEYPEPDFSSSLPSPVVEVVREEQPQPQPQPQVPIPEVIENPISILQSLQETVLQTMHTDMVEQPMPIPEPSPPPPEPAPQPTARPTPAPAPSTEITNAYYSYISDDIDLPKEIIIAANALIKSSK